MRFLKGAVPFFKLVRNTRDCLEHKNSKGVVVKDFEVQADGQVHPPTIAVNFRASHQPIVAVAVFMSGNCVDCEWIRANAGSSLQCQLPTGGTAHPDPYTNACREPPPLEARAVLLWIILQRGIRASRLNT